MLSGGEKAKIKSIIMSIKGDYSKMQDILSRPRFEKNQNNISELFDCNKRVFMCLAHLSTTLINSNEVLMRGFDALQASNRFNSISSKESKKVELLLSSIGVIPDIQGELIKMIEYDNDSMDKVLRDIMDELGIEKPKKNKKNDKKLSSMSFDDWFND